jgi:hypothetical protein
MSFDFQQTLGSLRYSATRMAVIGAGSPTTSYRYKGLFIWAKVIPVSEKTFRQVYKRDLALVRK